MATITEDYVSFEIAKMLKEKEFDWECEYFYDYYEEDDECVVCSIGGSCNSKEYPTYYSMPTLQTAMKWLRVNYNIHIEPRYFPMPNIYRYVIIHSPITIENIDSHPQYFNSYEEAVEAALKYCLENLI